MKSLTAVNYDKLWVILNERGMMKTELIRAAKISTNAMAKLGKTKMSEWKFWQRFV